MNKIEHYNNEAKQDATWTLPLTEPDERGKYKAIELSLHYSLGGLNYFSGATNARGYYVTGSVVELEKCPGYTMRSFMVGNGMRALVKETARKSPKAYREAVAYITPRVQDFMDKVLDAGVSPEPFKDKEVWSTALQPFHMALA